MERRTGNKQKQSFSLDKKDKNFKTVHRKREKPKNERFMRVLEVKSCVNAPMEREKKVLFQGINNTGKETTQLQ